MAREKPAGLKQKGLNFDLFQPEKENLIKPPMRREVLQSINHHVVSKQVFTALQFKTFTPILLEHPRQGLLIVTMALLNSPKSCSKL